MHIHQFSRPVVYLSAFSYSENGSYYLIKRRFPWCNGYRRREMDTVTRVQTLDETDCISHSINTIGKGMNPVIPPPAMGK